MGQNHQTLEHMLPRLAFEAALELAATGATTKAIAERLGCSPVSMAKILASNPPFRQAMGQAREIGLMNKAEMLEHIVSQNPFVDPNLLRLQSDNLKWLLSKLMPQVFGDKLDLTISKQVDIGSAIAEGRARTRLVNAPVLADGDIWAD
jgi:hypothetical protein